MKIACDFDSTLANTRVVAFDLMFGRDHNRDLTNGESLQSWDAPLEMFGSEKFLSAMWHSWTLRPFEVPILDKDIPIWMRALQKSGHTVDIVTAHADHMGVSKGKREWLDRQGIQYDNFVRVPPNKTKAKMDYDCYFDDKPSLPSKVNEHNPDANVYLIDWPYNQNAEGQYTRVPDVISAISKEIKQ